MKKTIETKKRKPPAERRDEILAAASRLAVAEGLERLTLRRVAEELGVVPGLVNHYFPVADDLVAAAFGYAAAAERDAILRAIDPQAPPLAQMRYIISHLLDNSADATSLLWLDAWQATRNRPPLRAEVAAQMLGWQEGMIGVIGRGVAAGVFGVSAPRRAAVRIMALIDGFSIQAAMRSQIAYDAVRDLVFETIARELGLPPGALQP
jgi:AcrR family transcriptional regulator